MIVITQLLECHCIIPQEPAIDFIIGPYKINYYINTQVYLSLHGTINQGALAHHLAV